MEFFTKKLRPMEELMKDPDLHLKIGRLIGAAEMAGYVLVQSTDAAAKNVGQQLSYVADWFFIMEKVKKGDIVSEADTRVGSPRK